MKMETISYYNYKGDWLKTIASSEREQGVVFRRVWREEREWRNYGILISKIKEKIKNYNCNYFNTCFYKENNIRMTYEKTINS